MFFEVVPKEALDQSQDLVSAKQAILTPDMEAHSIEVEAVYFRETCLIQSAVTRNLAAFNQLVEMYQDSLYWWAFSLVREGTKP